MTGEDLQEQSHVLGRLGQRADLVETAGEGHQPIAAHAAVGRLQAGHAAQPRRAADRTAGVGADGKRRHPRGHAGRRPAAGTAGNPRQIPRIMRGMEGRVLVRPAHGELVHVRLADQHGIGRLQPGDHRGVVGRAEVLQDSRGAGRRLALRAEHVLDRHRQPGQAAQGLTGRPAAIDLFRPGQRRLGIDSQEGPHAAVVAFDLVEIGPRQFDGRDSSGGQIGQVIGGGAVDQRHDALITSTAGTR